MSKIHIYIAPGSCALASHILLREAGLPFSITKLDVSASTKFPDSLQHLNAKKRVPILQIDDQIITETPAIMTAISQLAPEKHVLGTTELDVLRTYEWLNWLSGTLHTASYSAIFRPEHFVDDESVFAAVREKGKRNVQACHEAIETKLEGKTWAVGHEFTAVDAFLLVFWRWGNGVGFAMGELYPNYAGLVERGSRRQAVVDAMKEEGISLWRDDTV